MWCNGTVCCQWFKGFQINSGLTSGQFYWARNYQAWVTMNKNLSYVVIEFMSPKGNKVHNYKFYLVMLFLIPKMDIFEILKCTQN